MSDDETRSTGASNDDWMALLLSGHALGDDPTAWVEPARWATDTPHVLLVTFDGRPATWLEHWASRADCRPCAVSVISTQSGATGSAEQAAIGAAFDLPDGEVTVREIARPDDLTRYGIQISKQLNRWSDGAESIVLLWRSLSIMLQYVDVQRLFRFLTLLRGRIVETGTHGYFHLDPAAHDRETIETLKVVFDRVIDDTAAAD